jgi:hypothetical protein
VTNIDLGASGEPASRQLGRRHLLGAALATAAGALLPATTRARGRPEGGPTAPLGYVIGSETASGLGRSAPWLGASVLTVAPAASIAPDASLAGSTLRVAIYGLFPGTPAAGGPATATLDALFPSSRKGQLGSYPFAAWTFVAGQPAKCGSTVTFSLPVGAGGNAGFDLGLSDGTATSHSELSLSTDANSQGPKLRSGFYLIGLASGAWAREIQVDPSAPADWSLLSLVMSVNAVR